MASTKSPRQDTQRQASADWLQRVQPIWQGMSARERIMVAAALGTVLLAVLWWVAIAPAWRTLQAAPAQHLAIDAKLERLGQWSAEARGLNELPIGPVPPRNVVTATLQSSAQTLGAGTKISITGERAMVQLGPTDAPTLARWLSQMRINARVLPINADVKRVGERWTGSLELTGPGLREDGPR